MTGAIHNQDSNSNVHDYELSALPLSYPYELYTMAF